MQVRFDIAAGVAAEATSARALVSAHRRAWHEPQRLLEATESLFTQASAPLHRAEELESTTFGGRPYLRARHTAEWAEHASEGLAALQAAQHGAASFNTARLAAERMMGSIPDSAQTMPAPHWMTEAATDPNVSEFVANVAARAAAEPKTRIRADEMHSAVGLTWSADHGAEHARRILDDIADVTSYPPL